MNFNMIFVVTFMAFSSVFGYFTFFDVIVYLVFDIDIDIYKVGLKFIGTLVCAILCILHWVALTLSYYTDKDVKNVCK